MPHIPRERPAKESSHGYVYLLHMNGTYKIGRCKSWRSRSRAYSGMPHKVTLEVLLKTVCMIKLEKDLHDRYRRKRMGGEWFALSVSEVEEIRQHPLRVDQEI